MTDSGFVLSLRKSHGLALLLGLFNFTFDGGRQRFTESAVLCQYARLCRWVVRILALSLILAYLEILYGFRGWKDTAKIQDRVLWYVNLVQGYIAVLLTYANHSRNKSHLLRMLNGIVACNKNLGRVLGRDGGAQRRFYVYRKVRILTAVVDILITFCQPKVFALISHEMTLLVVLNKLVMMSSFLGQHNVQTFLGSAFHRMEGFVRRQRADMLSPDDYRQLSKICSQLHKIRLSSNAYHGAFGLISYLSLIRTICFCYSCFSTLFTSGIMRHGLLCTLLIYFFWMMVPAITVLLDFVSLGFMAELVQRAVKDFFLSVYLAECNSSAGFREIEVILQKEHVENMETLTTSGMVMDRRSAFESTFEVLSWVVVAFVYNGGHYNPAAMAFGFVIFNAKAFLLWVSALGGIGFCGYKAGVYLTHVCQGMISNCSEEAD